MGYIKNTSRYGVHNAGIVYGPFTNAGVWSFPFALVGCILVITALGHIRGEGTTCKDLKLSTTLEEPSVNCELTTTIYEVKGFTTL